MSKVDLPKLNILLVCFEVRNSHFPKFFRKPIDFQKCFQVMVLLIRLLAALTSGERSDDTSETKRKEVDKHVPT